jgi:SAM-dependent methyltransferase
MSLQRKHLDLGCGQYPKNPFGYERIFGIDIRAGLTADGVEQISAANLSAQPIPFPDNSFDAISAYDFLEHVPRVVINSQGNTVFPFIQLMNEIWRVLRPDGLFYAQTPAYPSAKAFQDPTHVNIITDKTHTYFTEPKLLGKMYGFQGTFKLVRQVRTRPDQVYESEDMTRRLKRLGNDLRRRNSHLIWEFSAVKPSTHAT